MSTVKLIPTPKCEVEDGDLYVRIYWGGAKLDRPHTWGVLIGPVNARTKALASRYNAAVRDGMVFKDPVVVMDNYGQTYVQARNVVNARVMNAELRRLGY